MSQGLNSSIYIVFEIIMAISVFILIAGGIFFVSNPNFSRSYIFEKEMSYVSSITPKDMKVELDLSNTKFSDVKVQTDNNKVSVNVKGKGSAITTGGGTEYFGKDVKIEQKSSNIIMITN